MRVTGLDHIVLNVRDVEASLTFYQQHLGLAGERVEAWRGGMDGTAWQAEVTIEELWLNIPRHVAQHVADLDGEHQP